MGELGTGLQRCKYNFYFNLSGLSDFFLKNIAYKVLYIWSFGQTSVLCKSAVHSGAASNVVGGRVTVYRERSLTLYESTFANGILSKMCVCFLFLYQK